MWLKPMLGVMRGMLNDRCDEPMAPGCLPARKLRVVNSGKVKSSCYLYRFAAIKCESLFASLYWLRR